MWLQLAQQLTGAQQGTQRLALFRIFCLLFIAVHPRHPTKNGGGDETVAPDIFLHGRSLVLPLRYIVGGRRSPILHKVMHRSARRAASATSTADAGSLRRDAPEAAEVEQWGSKEGRSCKCPKEAQKGLG